MTVYYQLNHAVWGGWVKNCQTGIKNRVGADVHLPRSSKVRRGAKSWACGPGSDEGVRPKLCVSAGRCFHFKQRFLTLHPPAVAPQFPVRAKNAMARNSDGDRVCSASPGHGAHRRGPTNGFGDLQIGASLTKRNGLQIRPHPSLESGRLNIKWELRG